MTLSEIWGSCRGGVALRGQANQARNLTSPKKEFLKQEVGDLK